MDIGGALAGGPAGGGGPVAIVRVAMCLLAASAVCR